MQLQVKDLPKVPTWRLERESNPRPFGWKSSSQPGCHHAPRFLVRNCLTGSAPQYIKAYCIPFSSIPSRSTLRSSARGHLVVPRTQTSMTQSRSVSVVGPSNWNKLPQSLRDLFPISSDPFRKHLKTFIFVGEDTDPGREHLWLSDAI